MGTIHLANSFRNAGKGLMLVWRAEPNFRIQFLIGLAAISAGIGFELPAWKIIILMLMTVFVLVLEVVNSIFERLADAFEPRIHVYVRDMKDLMAGAVLMASITSVIMGIILFWPVVASIMNRLLQ